MTALVIFSPFHRRQDISIIYSRVNLCDPITNMFPEEDSRSYSYMTYHPQYTAAPAEAIPLNADKIPPPCP